MGLILLRIYVNTENMLTYNFFLVFEISLFTSVPLNKINLT